MPPRLSVCSHPAPWPENTLSIARSASIGFSRLAFLAGTHPKIIPMAAENPNPRIIASTLIRKAVPITWLRIMLSPSPSRIPAIPPIRLSRKLSIRNCSWICHCRAPSAFLSPISIVRSVTVVSIMFMIPMPPTSRAMEAIPASRLVIMPIMVFIVSSMASIVVMVKQSSSKENIASMACSTASEAFSLPAPSAE